MKIESAWIDEPLRRGELDHPKLCIQVDRYPDVGIPDSPQGNGWIVGKWGPFLKYSNSGRKVTAADFNTALASQFQPLVDISVFLGESDAYTDEYALPLNRARAQVKKWAPEWRLVLHDREAQEGKILWLPVEKNPRCKFLKGNRVCGKEISGYAHRSGIDVPYCRDHLQNFNHEQAAKRAEAASK